MVSMFTLMLKNHLKIKYCRFITILVVFSIQLNNTIDGWCTRYDAFQISIAIT